MKIVGELTHDTKSDIVKLSFASVAEVVEEVPFTFTADYALLDQRHVDSLTRVRIDVSQFISPMATVLVNVY